MRQVGKRAHRGNGGLGHARLEGEDLLLQLVPRLLRRLQRVRVLEAEVEQRAAHLEPPLLARNQRPLHLPHVALRLLHCTALPQ